MIIESVYKSITLTDFAYYIYRGYQEFQPENLLPSELNATVIADACYKNEASIVAMDGDDVAGIVAVSDSRNGELEYRYPVATGWLYYVSPEFRGRGKRILSQMCRASRKKLEESGIQRIIGEAQPEHRVSRWVLFREGFRVKKSVMELRLNERA